jgi:uncharacterized SAM-binding protein YcdF (DUF218 family)
LWRLILIGFIVWLLLVAGLIAVIHITGQQDNAQEADTIIVLGAGLTRNGRVGDALRRRSQHAATLWHDGYAETIICTGGQAQGQSRSEADGCLEVLLSAGIPRTAVLLESNSHSTEENALYSRDLMEANGWQNAILVSDSFHMLRADFIFSTRGHEVVLSPVSSSKLRKTYYATMIGREVLAMHWQIFKDAFNLPITHVP